MFFKRKKQSPHHPDFPQLGEVSYRKVLSFIEEKKKPNWYLEIGSRSGDSLASLKSNYIAIDPEFCIRKNVFNKSEAMLFFQQTSDAFFESGFLQRSQIKPDLAFIDGMHLYEFALRDFMNLEKAMNRDGFICFHDVCPFNYEMTTRDVSYLSQGLPWTGDVWKTIHVLHEMRPDLKIEVLDAHKTGIAVVTNLNPSDDTLDRNYDDLMRRYQNVELKDLGASAYYGKFKLVDTAEFVSRSAL